MPTVLGSRSNPPVGTPKKRFVLPVVLVFFLLPTWSALPTVAVADPDLFLPNTQVDHGSHDVLRSPAASFGPNGALYLAYAQRGISSQTTVLMFDRSDDGGMSWLPQAVPVTTAQSPSGILPSMGVMEDGGIAVAWGQADSSRLVIRFSRSTDAGNTWSPALTIHPGLDTDSYSRPCLAVAGSRLVVSFRKSFMTPPYRAVGIVFSDDQGQTWSEPVLIDPAALPHPIGEKPPVIAWNGPQNALGMLILDESDALYFFSSTDGGAHWSFPSQVNDIATHVDSADMIEGNGAFQVAWAGLRPGTHVMDVYYTRTVDGIHWKPGVRVNNEVDNGAHPHIRFDAAGALHVDFIFSTALWADLYYSLSLDAGENWLAPAARVNDVAGSVLPDAENATPLLADSGSRAYLFWTDLRSPQSEHIYFSRSSVAAGAEEPVGRQTASLRLRLLGSPGPEPCFALSGDAVESAVESRVTFELFAATGVRTGIWTGRVFAGLGRHGSPVFFLRALNGGKPLPAGVFFLRASTGTARAAVKAVVVR